MRKLVVMLMLLVAALLLASCAPATPDPAVVARLVGEGVQATVQAMPTWTPYPTLEPLPSYTPYPTFTPIPKTPTPTLTPTPVDSPTPPSTATPKAVSALSAKSLMAEFDKRTALQAKSYMDSLVGTRVQWEGEISSVSETGRIGITIFSGTTAMFGTDFLFAYVPLSVEQAMKLNKDQTVTIEGDIAAWEEGFDFLRIILENGRLVK